MRRLFPLFLLCAGWLSAQEPPYTNYPPVQPPYFRVRYAAPTTPGGLAFPASYTLWIPPGVKTVRGVVVHQHGCGEGSCRSGLTGAFDLHWQALARRHDCALLSPVYEQPEKANCQLWCDPRQGSDAAFRQALADLAAASGHPELASAPWALWGHSGGGLWAGGMTLLHPERVVAAWLRSGVPSLKPTSSQPAPHVIPAAALQVPVMCNLGTLEGVTDRTNRFAGVWPANEAFFRELRGRGGLVGVAIDPLSSHECGNQRYLAIPWLNACLAARLPRRPGQPLQAMPGKAAWLAPLPVGAPGGAVPVPAARFTGARDQSVWLPDATFARAWARYGQDTGVTDTTPPPTPVRLRVTGRELTWEAEADLESGLAHFVIERDGRPLATVPAAARNPFGRPLFQGLQYSDTPAWPLARLQFTDTTAQPGRKHRYKVMAVNTAGLRSKGVTGSSSLALAP